jgi:hypothetical protein
LSRGRTLGFATGELFVGDQLTNFGYVFFYAFDFLWPVAPGVIGVGDAGGVLALGLGEVVEEDVQTVLEGGAGHMRVSNRLEDGA